MSAWTTVSVTGHRPQHLPAGSAEWARFELGRVMRKLVDDQGMAVAVSGMALGTDLWWAQRSVHAGLTLWAHVPFPQQPDPWEPAQRRLYAALVASAARVNTYGDLEPFPPAKRRQEAVRLLHARNDGMLNVSDAVVAVLRSGKVKGGTASAFRKARVRGLPIIRIDPDRRTVTQVLPAWEQGA